MERRPLQSLPTQATFFKMRALFFENTKDAVKHMNIHYALGIGANCVKGDGGAGGDRGISRAVSHTAMPSIAAPTGGGGGAAAGGGGATGGAAADWEDGLGAEGSAA